MESIECLECGFVCEPTDKHCPKCDALIHAQTDGTTVTVDIAHRNETIDEAKAKLDDAIGRELARRTQTLRVITGRGTIRDAIGPHLGRLRSRGRIIRFQRDGRNRGAVLVRLR